LRYIHPHTFDMELTAEMRKRLNFCGSGSTLKKEAGSGSKLKSD